MSKLIGSFLSLVLLFGGAVLSADETASDAGAFYSRGTNLFFSDDYAGAAEQFDGAMALAPDNPVYLYFRGLCDLRRGDSDSASGWFTMAAEKEQTPSGRLIDVGANLRRVQGADRMMIEEIRRQARKAWEDEETRRQTALYGETLDRQKEILSRQQKTDYSVPSKKSVETISDDSLPIVPPIEPLSGRQEIDASMSIDLAEYGNGEIIYLKDELGKVSLSTSAQKRREARARRLAYANPMDRPAADGSKFVDIYSNDEVAADGQAFDDGGESITPAEAARQRAEAAQKASEAGPGGIFGMTQPFLGAGEGTSNVDVAEKTNELFGEEKTANPFADKPAAPSSGEFKLFEEDKQFVPAPAAPAPAEQPAAPVSE